MMGRFDNVIHYFKLMMMLLYFNSFRSCSAMVNNMGATTTRTLSGGLQISSLGIGTWAWGDQLYWRYDPIRDDEGLRETFNYCLDSGYVNLFDTAEGMFLIL